MGAKEEGRCLSSAITALSLHQSTRPTLISGEARALVPTPQRPLAATGSVRQETSGSFLQVSVSDGQKLGSKIVAEHLPKRSVLPMAK